MPRPNERSVALAAGEKFYFTGRPCRHGHVADRYAEGASCVACRPIVSKKYRSNPENVRREVERNRVRQRDRKHALIPGVSRPRPELCECCGGPTNGAGVLHLDHDHATGLFRGWLCHLCNTGIGKLGDNEAGVMRAIEYLRRAKCSAS